MSIYMELNMFRRRRSACVIQRGYRQRPGYLFAQPTLGKQGFALRESPQVPHPTPAHEGDTTAAACLIQRCYVTQRKNRAHWAKLVCLRKTFIDAEVVQPGGLLV